MNAEPVASQSSTPERARPCSTPVNPTSAISGTLHGTLTSGNMNSNTTTNNNNNNNNNNKDSIHVAVRVRPLNERERNAGQWMAWQVRNQSHLCPTSTIPESASASAPTTLAWLTTQTSGFTFDRVVDVDEDSRTLYDAIARDIVHSSVAGMNGTIFAYGQTSSGKTHTMQGTDTCPGIIPLAVQDIFHIILMTPDREFLLRVSYLEIYNEQIRDLLNPQHDNLRIHETPSRDIYVGGLTEEVVTSAAEVYQILDKGAGNRHVGVTNMNERSSRSHTLFRIVIESRDRNALDSPSIGPSLTGKLPRSSLPGGSVRMAWLNLVDLAGSERVGHTGAEGMRLKEGTHINKSLLALGTVIKKLSDGQDTHIPYRDSKLTRILQTSLGGNARTAIVCTITPASGHVEESLSTLKFAARAKTISNKPEVNEIVSDEVLLKRYRKEIEELRRQLLDLQSATHHEERVRMAELGRITAESLHEEAQRRIDDLEQQQDELERRLLSKICEELDMQTVGSKRQRTSRRQTWFLGRSESMKYYSEESFVPNKRRSLPTTSDPELPIPLVNTDMRGNVAEAESQTDFDCADLCSAVTAADFHATIVDSYAITKSIDSSAQTIVESVTIAVQTDDAGNVVSVQCPIKDVRSHESSIQTIVVQLGEATVQTEHSVGREVFSQTEPFHYTQSAAQTETAAVQEANIQTDVDMAGISELDKLRLVLTFLESPQNIVESELVPDDLKPLKALLKRFQEREESVKGFIKDHASIREEQMMFLQLESSSQADALAECKSKHDEDKRILNERLLHAETKWKQAEFQALNAEESSTCAASELNELRQTLLEKDGTIEFLEQRLVDLQTRNNGFTSQFASFESNIASLKDEFEKERDEWQLRMRTDLSKIVQEHQSTVKELRNENETLSQDLKTCQDVLKIVQADNDKKISGAEESRLQDMMRINQLEEVLQSRTANLENFHTVKMQLEKALKISHDEISTLKDMLEQLQACHNEEESGRQELIQGLEDKLLAALEDADGLRRELQSAVQEKEQMSSRFKMLSGLQDELIEVKNTLDSEIARRMESEAKLAEFDSNLTKARLESSQVASSLREERDRLQTEIIQLEEWKSTAETKIVGQLKMIDAFEEKIHVLSSQLQSAQLENESFKRQNMLAEAELHEYLQKNQAYEQTLTAHVQTIETLEVTKGELRSHVQSLQHELESSKRAQLIAESSITDLKSELHESETAFEALQAEMMIIKQNCEELNLLKSNLENGGSTMTARLEEYERRISDMQEELNLQLAGDATIAELTKVCEEQVQTIRALQNDLDNANVAHEKSYQKTIDSLKEERMIAENLLVNRNLEISSLKTKIDDSAYQIESLSAENKLLSSKLDAEKSATADVDAAQHEIAFLKSLIEKGRPHLADLEEELSASYNERSRLQSSLEESLANQKTLLSEKIALETNVRRLENDLKSFQDDKQEDKVRAEFITLKDLNESFVTEIADLRSKLVSARERQNELERRSAEDLQTQAKVIENLRAKLDESSHALHSQQISMAETEVKFKQDLERYMALEKEAYNRFQSLESQISTHQEELIRQQELNQEMVLVKEKCMAQKEQEWQVKYDTEIERLATEIRKREQALLAVQLKLDQATAKDEESLEELKRKWKEEKSRLLRDMDRTQLKEAVLQTQIENLNARIVKERQLSSKRLEETEAKLKSLTSEFLELQGLLYKAQQEVSEKSAEVASLAKQLKADRLRPLTESYDHSKSNQGRSEPTAQNSPDENRLAKQAATTHQGKNMVTRTTPPPRRSGRSELNECNQQ